MLAKQRHSGDLRQEMQTVNTRKNHMFCHCKDIQTYYISRSNTAWWTHL